MNQGPIRRYSRRQVIGTMGVLYFAGLCLVVLVPGSPYVLGVVSGRSLSPLHWYSLFTFPVLHGSVMHWLLVVAFTAASLAVLVPRMTTAHILILWTGSAVVGGTTYALLAPTPSPAIGGGIVACGLAGAVVGKWFRQRNTFSGMEDVYAALLLVGVIGTLFLGVTPQDRSMLVAALVSAVYTYACNDRLALDGQA